uniref:Putative Type II secretory pathway protein H n=1 Tax=mine drainage metagenome TaxID=410659 RepID=E6PKK1_9ZZZZ
MKTSRGFTLIELMIVVAIVAILSAIALPAYNSYVTRSKLAEAFSGLSGLSVAMQQYYQDNRTYTDATTASNPDPWPCANVNLPTGKYFNFTCAVAAATPTQFTLTATATSPDLTTGGAMTYTIDQDGNKATTNVPAGWSKPNPNTCWVRDQSGNC